jgi:hypothetical protein
VLPAYAGTGLKQSITSQTGDYLFLFEALCRCKSAVKSLCRRVQLKICEKEEPGNSEILTMTQRIKLSLITFFKEVYQMTVKSFFDSIFGK